MPPQILRDSKQWRALLPKKGALQVVKTKTCLWYFCGQTRNRRSLHCGDFHFGGPDRIRTDDPYNANVVRSQLRYRPLLAIFQSKSYEKRIYKIFNFQGIVRKIGLLIGRGPKPWDVRPYECERSALPAELRAQIGHFSSKKVAKNRLDVQFRGKSPIN